MGAKVVPAHRHWLVAKPIQHPDRHLLGVAILGPIRQPPTHRALRATPVAMAQQQRVHPVALQPFQTSRVSQLPRSCSLDRL
jgi:hypothetical protein